MDEQKPKSTTDEILNKVSSPGDTAALLLGTSAGIA